MTQKLTDPAAAARLAALIAPAIARATASKKAASSTKADGLEDGDASAHPRRRAA
jgi:hypothetical protein